MKGIILAGGSATRLMTSGIRMMREGLGMTRKSVLSGRK